MSFIKHAEKLALIMAQFASVTALWGQIGSVQVFTKPNGMLFSVDGQQFKSAASFLWPAASKHVLCAEPIQTGIRVKTRFTFSSWTAAQDPIQPGGTCVVVTADPAVPFFEADFQTEYAVSLAFFKCGGQSPCDSPGTVFGGGTPYVEDAEIWVGAGGSLTLQAVPNPGYVFVGWQQAFGSVSTGFINVVTVNQPVGVYPSFQVARRVQLLSSPPGLQVLADRGPVSTPTILEWGWNTTHTLGVVSPQMDRTGNVWVFSSWSDNGSATHAYTVNPVLNMDTLTANYVPGARISFLTSPPGLPLKIDGRQNWQSYNFSWAAGETHRVEAPLEQFDAQGRKYVFRAWSNGGSAAQDVTLTDDDVSSGLRLSVFYDLQGRIALQSSALGIAVKVDGNDCATPCTIDRPIGTQVRVSAPASVNLGEGIRLDFQQWSDSPGADRTVTVTADVQTLAANYKLMNRLATAADPPEGASWRLLPSSPDSFYDAQSQVTVSLHAKPGYRFRQWEGDLSGGFTSGVVSMTEPRKVLARLDRVPYVDPAGIKNAAGDTPQRSVAPGSIVSIFGASLAPTVESGPDSPLAQTLADVTVRTADRLLPMFFVSPGQINVQLPSDLTGGPQTLTVKWEGQPEVRATFTVSRNAPGLFNQPVEDRAFGVFTHADGSPITTDSPAVRGETVTLYGTGFGPYDHPAPDGFAVPAYLSLQLVDPVDLVLAGNPVQPLSAGAAAGRVGVNAVQFQISDDLPSATVIEVKVSVNGVESNTVLLPLE